MTRYDMRILNGLLDSFEKSVLSRGENKVNIHIAYQFTRKTMPEYFDESSLAYDEIHAAVQELEQRGLLTIVWNQGKEGHIIKKVLLNEEKLPDAYSYVKRTAKKDYVEANLELLEAWRRQEEEASVVGVFCAYLMQRIQEGKSVKEFIDLTDTKGTEQLLQALSRIENNQEECYIREFSIRLFGDSKKFKKMKGAVKKVMRRFHPGFSEMDIAAILAEYRIYHTPNYVYLKGEGRLLCPGESAPDTDASSLRLSLLRQGVGISGEDIKKIKIQDTARIKRVITIENLTTFFRWEEEDSLMIYLGGYHNSERRELLCMLYEEHPDAEYLHFGDIDVGGFEIYRDLCRKTGISFQTYRMGTEELKKYRRYTKKLTKNDNKRLERMIENEQSEEIVQVLEYMKKNQVKLEQEAIL